MQLVQGSGARYHDCLNNFTAPVGQLNAVVAGKGNTPRLVILNLFQDLSNKLIRM